MGDQSEEEALALSSSGHIEQIGANAVSWSNGLISQMSNCGPGKRRRGPGGLTVRQKLSWVLLGPLVTSGGA